MAQYQIDPTLLLSVNLNNVLDKGYYQTVGTIYNGNMQGLPRNAMVTLRKRF
jgi:iron complex outermembrane receptor protein/outer membrane receptor for ferric coprogen and ferric-rhodotorulic acid